MGTLVNFTKTLAAANANAIAAPQTPGGAGDLTLTATPVVLDTERQVLFTFSGDDSADTFVLYGTTAGGNAIQETIVGGTGTVVSTRMYKTVTRISISAAAAFQLTVGTNGVGASSWQLANYQISPANLSIGCVVTGTVNYTLQYTYDDFWSVPLGQSQGNTPVAYADAAITAATATKDTAINDPISGWRLLINSGTGSVTVSAIQAGIAGN